MLRIQKNLMRQKFLAIQQKGIPYLISGFKRQMSPRVKSIGIYILDLQKDQEGMNVRKQALDSLRGNLEMKILSDQDRSYLQEYLKLRDDKFFTPEFIEFVLRKGCLIVLAIDDGRIAGANTIGFSDFPLDSFELDFILREDQAYSFNTFVPSDMRGRGVGYLLVDYSAQLLREKGHRFFIAAIYGWNAPSIKIYSRLGFKKHLTIEMVEQFFTKRYRFIEEPNTEEGLLTLKLFKRKFVTK